MHKECQLRLKSSQAIKVNGAAARVGGAKNSRRLLCRNKANVCCDSAAVLLQLTCWNCRVPLNVILFYLAAKCGADIIVSGWVLHPTTALLWRSIVLNTFSAPRYGNIGGHGLKPMTALCLIANSGRGLHHLFGQPFNLRRAQPTLVGRADVNSLC